MRTFIAVVQLHYHEVDGRSGRLAPILDADAATIARVLREELESHFESMMSDEGPMFDVNVVEGIRTPEYSLAQKAWTPDD